MSRNSQTPRVAMQLSRDVVVASIQVDLDDDVLARFREDLLGRVHATAPRAVFLDVSGLETLDSAEFAAIRRVVTMVKIMGTESVIVGLRPGVVSALMATDAPVDGLLTAVDLDAAYALLEPDTDAAEEADPSAGDPDDEPADEESDAAAEDGR